MDKDIQLNYIAIHASKVAEMINICKTNDFLKNMGYPQTVKSSAFKPINRNNPQQSICQDIGKAVNKILCHMQIKLKTVYSVSNIIVVKISYLKNICRIYRVKIYICLRLQAPVNGYKKFSKFLAVMFPLELKLFFLSNAKLFCIFSLFVFLYSAITSKVFDCQSVSKFNNIKLCFRDINW